MDILKAVLGPKGYKADNLVQEFPPNKRRRMDYGGEEDDYQQGPQAHSNRGLGESQWGPSSFNERFSKESDGNRWGQQPKHQNREQEENRWGSSRNARHSEDRDEGKWGSKSHGGEHFGRGFNNQEKWGAEPQNRNNDNFAFEREGGNWRGERNQNQWGPQAHNERQGREQNSSRWGSQSHSEYRGGNQEQRWEPPESFHENYDDNDQRWGGSRSFDSPPEKRRKPLLGPYPEFEKPKPKSLLGPYPGPEKNKPKAKPLLGPYPGHDKPKPKPLLGSFPGSDRPKPKSLLGPYPGHGQDEDDYQWEPASSRGAMRSRGGRGGRVARGVGSLGRGRGLRNRRQMNAFEQEGMGYEEPQSLMQSFEDDFQGEHFPPEQSLEYQESGWYDDSEWGPCEQFEGGEEFWPQNYDESQSWQYDDFAWQYGDEQVQQFMQQGGYQPPRLSVRERLGAKKPALLGAAPSVDLVKQLLTPDERKRLSKKYGSLPLEALYCHMCDQSKFSSVDSYLMHQIGKKHVAMTRSFYAKSNATYHVLKSDVKMELRRDLSIANVPTDGYCPTCDVPKWGKSHHMGIAANRLLHRFVKPLCCNNQRFASRLQYENHRLSLKHLENDYKKMVASEERFKKRLSELKEEMKTEGMEEEIKQIEEEEERIGKLFTVAERIKAIWTLLVPKMNSLGKEKLPDKIVKLKTLREINLRMKKPIKNTVQLVPFDPSEPVGIGNMIVSTHFRCSICSKSIEPDKESVLAHCSSEDHYKNALRKQEEMRNAEKLAQEKKEEDDEGSDGEQKEEEVENNDDIGDDEPMEDPYEGESGDINTLMNEVEEMIDNEDEDSREADNENVPEGFVDNDELIYDDGDIAEEFREVLDYNPDDVEDEGSFEEAETEGKPAGRAAGGAGRKAKATPKKEKPATKASPTIRRTRKK
ncbi:uncharacterized protein LOC135208520 isoform X1 [Macrobrachium nipponense]|uniref:uncharacterized protein LOC135208520 isoform X1 n=1 Tax=Macrobrachium nipponense TaxID=159736 RepID=UPI0030C820DC